MNNQEIAIVGLSILVAWLCWVIRGAVLSSRDKSKDFALLQDTCDTWRETATRRAGELTEAWKQLKEHRESIGQLEKDSDYWKTIAAGMSVDLKKANLQITDLGRDSGSWRALRREIADCFGFTVPEGNEPPSHGQCVSILRQQERRLCDLTDLLAESRDMLQKYVDASAELVKDAKPDPQPIQFNRDDGVAFCPCGKVLPGNSVCNCDICCKSRTSFTFPESHNGPDHSEPLSPAMGVSEKAVNHPSILENFKAIEAHVEREFGPVSKTGCTCLSCGRSCEEHVAEALTPTADSIENAISHPDKMQFHRENIRHCQRADQIARGMVNPVTDAGDVEAVLAHAEDRSNNYG